MCCFLSEPSCAWLPGARCAATLLWRTAPGQGRLEAHAQLPVHSGIVVHSALWQLGAGRTEVKFMLRRYVLWFMALCAQLQCFCQDFQELLLAAAGMER